MNREIKFRAKRPDNSEWVYGSLTTQKPSPRFRGDFCIFDGAWYVIDPSTIGQYTGLKDVNSKEIYEGDIIESVFMPIKPSENDQVILGVVEWWAERAEYIVNCNNIDDFDIKALRNRSGYKYADGKFTMSFALKGKVIGSIHDDPELLKGGEK